MSALAEIPAANTFEGSATFLPLVDRSPGVVLLAIDAVERTDLLAVLLACAGGGRGWVPVLVELSGDDLVGVPLSAGYRYPIQDIVRFCRGEEDGHLGIHQVIDRVRVARHDINNPLAAALAETQLLLMDPQSDDTRRALEAIQAQLRRIAALVGGLAFAPPPPPSGATEARS